LGKISVAAWQWASGSRLHAEAVDSPRASPYLLTLVERTGRWMILALLTVALARTGEATEVRPFVAGDVIHRDFGTLLESRGEHSSRILAESGRIADPNDKLATTFYRNSGQRISVRATVLTFGDPTWLVQELVGDFTAVNGLALTDGTIVTGDGAARRLETQRDSSDATTRVVAWPSGANHIVELTFGLRGADRATEVQTEIVDAYLAAYPSSLPDAVVDTPKYHLEWMRNEMARLLAYAKRNLVLARAALEQRESALPTSEQYRIEAVRLLRRAVALRQSVYGVGDEKAFAAQFQKAAIAAIGPDMTLDKAKLLAFTDEQLRELDSWWESHRDDW
jgi:hypothetical protein